MGLGRAVLTLSADGSQLDAALANAKGRVRQAVGEMKREFSSFGTSLGGIGSSISTMISRVSSTLVSVGSTITRNVTVPVLALGAGLIAVGADAIKTGADFEKAMSGVQAILGASNEELERLKNLAMNLGLDPNLIVSASQAAAVMEELAKNGLTTDQILNGAARAAIALANATGTDFGTAAQVASTAMQLFNLNGEQMVSIVNNITGVANASRFSVEDFAQAMAMGGGVAAAMGVPIEDFAVVIAGLSTSFSSGSDAGTSFKVFLQRLAPETDKATEAMKELGLITEEDGNRFFDAEGNMKSLAEIAGILQEAFKDLSDEQKIQALHTIFGTDAMRAANAMAELGADGFEKLAETMAKTDASENAATRMNNLAGAMEILSGIAEALKIKFTEAFGPGVRRVVEGFSNFLSTHSGEIDNLFKMLGGVFDKFADILVEVINQNGPLLLDFFRKVIQSLPLVIGKLQEIGTVAAPYLEKFFDAFTKVTPERIAKIIETILGLAAAGPSLLFLGKNLVPLIIGIGIAIVNYLLNHKEEIKEFFLNFSDRVREFSEKLKEKWPAIQEFFQKILEKLPGLMDKLKEIGSVAGPQVQKLVDAFMKMKPETIIKLIELVGALYLFAKVAGILGSIGMFFTGLASIGTILSGLAGISTFIGTLGSVFASLGAILTGGVLLPLLVIIGTLALLYLAWKTNFGGIRTTVEQLAFLVVFWFNDIKTKVSTTLKQLAFIIKYEWDQGMAHMKETVQSTIDNIKARWEAYTTYLKNLFNAVWNAIVSYVKSKANEILTDINNHIALIKEAFNIDWSELGKFIIDGIVAGLKNGINAVIEAAKAVAQGALDAAKDILGIQSPSMAFAELGNFSGMGFTQGLQRSLAPQKISGIMNHVVAGAAQTMNRSTYFNTTVNNPKPEPASKSLDRTLRKLSWGVDK